MTARFIGCATDTKFVEPTAVMLSSVDANGCVPDATILVAAFDLSDKDKGKIRTGAGGLAARLRFVEVTQAMFGHVKRDFTEEYPPAVLGRLFLADGIEEHNARLITLDSDMIINRSLEPLFKLDLGVEYFAAVHDLPNKGDPNYFNSGMTVTEVGTYKFHNVGHRSLEWLKANPGADCPDQDALNSIVGDRWHRLDGCWNRYLVEDRPIILEDYETASIAHFAHRKPWDWCKHPGAPLYNRYLAAFHAKLDLQDREAQTIGSARTSIWTKFPLSRKLAATKKISLRIDRDVLMRFRAAGPGWETRINEALRRAAP